MFQKFFKKSSFWHNSKSDYQLSPQIIYPISDLSNNI